jgi:CxxC-x17-CxxC domain-containing protein
MTDKIPACRDCGVDFVFTAGEQDFFASRGLTGEPGRCPTCRAERKADRGGKYTGGAYTSGGLSSTFGQRREREVFPVVCGACGTNAHVPFLPREDRPGYCLDCFGRQRDASYASRGGSGGRRW